MHILGRSKPTMEMKMNPATVTVSNACTYSNLCKSTLYNLIREGKLESRTVGRRRLIVVSSLDRLLGLDERHTS